MAIGCPVKQKSKACSKGGTVRSKGSVNCAENVENSNHDEIINDEALVTSDQVNDFEWIIDAGVTQYMTFDVDSLSDYVDSKEPCTLTLGHNGAILAYGKGTYRTVADLEDKIQYIALHDVLYLADLKKNLLSVKAMTVVSIGGMQGKLYILKVVPIGHIILLKRTLICNYGITVLVI